MLPGFRNLSKPAPRCLTVGTLPNFVDPRQPPRKRKPFGVVLQQECVHSVDVIFPAEFADIVKKELEQTSGETGLFPLAHLRYAKVILSLGDILEEAFLSRYVKTGNVIVISEGKRGVDNRLELVEGVLRLELDKPTYERAGLAGKSMSDSGQKHKPNRFAIAINLRQPSMLHGKKGFERIVWAARNVLVQSMTCIFFDCSTDRAEETPSPLDRHHPRWITIQPTESVHADIVIPQLITQHQPDTHAEILDDRDLAIELEEWISLVILQSPRIKSTDHPDPFICRYSCPDSEMLGRQDDQISKNVTQELMMMSWRGLMPSSFTFGLLLLMTKALKAGTDGAWWSMRATGLRRDGDTITILRPTVDHGQTAQFYCWHGIT